MDRDPYQYFRIEAREILEQLGQGTLDLEKGSATPDLVARLLRLAHTLKGAARVVRQQKIADQAHAVEDVLASARDSTEAISRDRVDLVLSLLDSIGRQVADLTLPSRPGADTLVPPEEVFRAFRPDIHEMDVLLHGVAEAYSQLASLRPRLARLERGKHVADLVLEQLAPLGKRETISVADNATYAKAQSMAEELRGMFGTLEQDVAYAIDQIDQELREIRSAAERLQLVPASALFTLLERAARDAAQAVDKQVVFEGRGGNIRVDARVLSVVQGALLQVIRNAVAHGIESTSGRMAGRKPPAGRVTLTVLRRGTKVSFGCTDDGAGVDLDAVRRIAQRKGLLSPEFENLGSEELFGLLLKGGISTSGSVTEVSGRGIGLDVVREAAERLDGEVTVRTEKEGGTTIELMVPLSLASFEGLLVEASGITAAIPIDAIHETTRVSSQQLVQSPAGGSILQGGDNIPFVPLARTIAPALTQLDGASGPWTAVIVKGQTARACLAVDRIIGTETVVLRPLPALAPAIACVAGASLDVEGNPRLVLEPDGLVAAAQGVRPESAAAEKARPSILIVDDSLTTRMLEQSILESAGYDADLACSGEEALEKARATRYALFLVDIEMPGMDGFTFIERIRVEPDLKGVPAILVTSRSSPDDQRRGREAGAQGFIIKSEFDQGMLLDRIRRLVG